MRHQATARILNHDAASSDLARDGPQIPTQRGGGATHLKVFPAVQAMAQRVLITERSAGA
jgi:hypothetical protein